MPFDVACMPDMSAKGLVLMADTDAPWRVGDSVVVGRSAPMAGIGVISISRAGRIPTKAKAAVMNPDSSIDLHRGCFTHQSAVWTPPDRHRLPASSMMTRTVRRPRNSRESTEAETRKPWIIYRKAAVIFRQFSEGFSRNVLDIWRWNWRFLEFRF